MESSGIYDLSLHHIRNFPAQKKKKKKKFSLNSRIQYETETENKWKFIFQGETLFYGVWHKGRIRVNVPKDKFILSEDKLQKSQS